MPTIWGPHTPEEHEEARQKLLELARKLKELPKGQWDQVIREAIRKDREPKQHSPEQLEKTQEKLIEVANLPKSQRRAAIERWLNCFTPVNTTTSTTLKQTCLPELPAALVGELGRVVGELLLECWESDPQCNSEAT